MTDRPLVHGLAGLNPLTVLAITVTAVAAATSLTNLALLLVVYAVCLFPLALWSGVGREFLKISAKLIWPFALSLFLIQGFFAPGQRVLFEVGPFSFKSEGVVLAAYFCSRLLLGMGAATLLMLTTRPDSLTLALTQRGLPQQVAYILVTALQIIPSFQSKARSILDAQQSRGFETRGSLRRRVAALVPLVTPLVLGSLMDLEERAMALEARGFGRQGPRTSYRTLPDSRIQAVSRWLLVAVCVILILARLVPA